jgi:hydroxyacylglutathione hydrolase
MISIKFFTFNPFAENTYLLYDETKECVIIDPGCYGPAEQQQMDAFISEKGLKPVKLLNTHCHIDHILGIYFTVDKYKLELYMHREDLPVLKSGSVVAEAYGFKLDPPPDPSHFLEEGDTVTFGNSSLNVIFTPGHSPGSITFYSKNDNFAIVGDVLFNQSIGRSDLPGGDHNTLISSIKNKLFPLGDSVLIYPGHGEKTTIGFEKQYNPFLN